MLRLAELDPKVVLSSEQLLQPTVFSTDPRLKTAAEQANTMIGADIVLTMGKSTAAEVNADLISQWVTVDENVQAVLDEEAMRAWVDKLAGDCDTVGTTRTYTRARWQDHHGFRRRVRLVYRLRCAYGFGDQRRQRRPC